MWHLVGFLRPNVTSFVFLRPNVTFWHWQLHLPIIWQVLLLLQASILLLLHHLVMPKRSLDAAGEDGFKFPDKVYRGLLRETFPVALRKLSLCSKKLAESRAGSPKRRQVPFGISAPGELPATTEPSADVKAAIIVLRDSLLAEMHNHHSLVDAKPAFLFLHVFPGEDMYFCYEGLAHVAPILASLYLNAAQASGVCKVERWKSLL
jgi:hypothetical protein